MALDTKTLWFALGVSCFLFGVMMLIHPHSAAGRSTIRLWATAQIVKATAIGLILAKPALAYPWSFTGNSLYLIGLFAELLALLAYAGFWRKAGAVAWTLAGILAVYNLGVARIPHGMTSGEMAMLFSLSLAVPYLLGAAALWAARREKSPIQALLFTSMLVTGAIALLRAWAATVSTHWDPSSAGFANQALFIAGFIFSLSDGFCFLLLVKEDADRHLLRLATVDELTGLMNRATFLARAEDRRRMTRRTGRPSTLVMLDVDHFKRINDSLGHAAGDAVLRDLGERFRAMLRDVDLAGRMGGEEFCMVLSETPTAAAHAVAERLRQAISGSPVLWEGKEISLTVSMGLAALSEGEALDVSMSLADRRLYAAKHSGRNRVVADTPLVDAPIYLTA